VERADGGAVELRQRLAAAFDLLGFGGRGGRTGLQGAPHAVAQLGAGLLGEGDGRDVAQLDLAGPHEGHDAVDQRRGLPRPRAGLHEQRGAEIGRDPGAGLLIGRGGGRGHDPARLAQGV
jgi:hypothetical protein